MRLASSIRRTGANSTARLFRPRQRRLADSTHPTFPSCTVRRIFRPVCTNAVSTVEDALFLATLRPVRELKLLNLVSFPDEPLSHPCEDLDHAMVMLFLAEPHAYPISRAIACAALDAGYDGSFIHRFSACCGMACSPSNPIWACPIGVSPNLGLWKRPR